MTRSDIYTDYRALLQHACLCTETNMVTRARDLQAFAFFGHRVSSTTQCRAAVIGFAGPKGCGKSTVATELLVSLKDKGINAQRHRFAGPIKDMARALGLTLEQIDGDEKETPCDLLGGCTPRYVMQTLGTQWGRDTISPDLWVNATMARVDAEPHAIAIIDDVRFPNEVAAIKVRGGYVIELQRHGVLYDADIPSEAGLPRELIDLTLANETDARVVALEALIYVASRRGEAAKDGAP